MVIRDDYRDLFEKMGLDKVISSLETGRFGASKIKHAKAWVGEQERAQKLEGESSKASSNREQIRIANSAKNAAWAAAIAAIIAGICAVITVLKS